MSCYSFGRGADSRWLLKLSVRLRISDPKAYLEKMTDWLVDLSNWFKNL